ncbi:hypothetical protein XENOCAPTIV_010561 [Xenoophorus captivus]|uniref:Uncharacterized protein n=1 Tax=Xenoophorus captivus TaxID=1517983 RepID=A0ABV0Q4S7_9TELE
MGKRKMFSAIFANKNLKFPPLLIPLNKFQVAIRGHLPAKQSPPLWLGVNLEHCPNSPLKMKVYGTAVNTIHEAAKRPRVVLEEQRSAAQVGASATIATISCALQKYGHYRIVVRSRALLK